MKKYLLYILSCMVCLSWTASCSTDDFEMAGPASSACIVSAVTMGQIPAVVNLKQTDGTDSLVVINVVGANYPMTIDHFGGRIYNLDSLPYGADVSKVTFTTLLRRLQVRDALPQRLLFSSA